MYDAKNIKAFKPNKATIREWERLEKIGDRAGLFYEKTVFITCALTKVSNAEMAREADRLANKIWSIALKRVKNGGITAEEDANAQTYYKMALAIAKAEAGSTAEVEIDR